MGLLKVTSDRLPWPRGSRIDESELASPIMAARLLAGEHLALISAGESSKSDVGAEDRQAAEASEDGGAGEAVSSKAGATVRKRRSSE